MKGQMSLFEGTFIKDADCTKDTPVVKGKPDVPIYGQGIGIRPAVPGRQDSDHFKRIYLEELLPLEEYDLVAVLLSGGKDSIACYYKLLELGVPKGKIEFWHHDIDGGHPCRRMDWRCTHNYVRSFAEAEGVPLRLSWRVNGFFGELYRVGASEPVEWLEPETGEVIRCKLSQNYIKCQEIKEKATDENHGGRYCDVQSVKVETAGGAGRQAPHVPGQRRDPPGKMVQRKSESCRAGQRDVKPGKDQGKCEGSGGVWGKAWGIFRKGEV